MTISLGMVTIDTADAVALSRWWATAFGGEITYEMSEYFSVVQIPGVPVNLGFQKVPDPTPGKNRIHLDLGASDAATLIADLLAKGASHVADQQMPNGMAWTVLADPDGNQFCVAAAEEH